MWLVCLGALRSRLRQAVDEQATQEQPIELRAHQQVAPIGLAQRTRPRGKGSYRAIEYQIGNRLLARGKAIRKSQRPLDLARPLGNRGAQRCLVYLKRAILASRDADPCERRFQSVRRKIQLLEQPWGEDLRLVG